MSRGRDVDDQGVTLTVDSNNKTDEANEGNNTHKLRVTRQ